MGEQSDEQTKSEGSPVASYEPPRLTPIGNLHDLLAGQATVPCEATSPAISGDNDPGLALQTRCSADPVSGL